MFYPFFPLNINNNLSWSKKMETTIAYIGDQPEKKWTSPITQKVYFFKKYGTAKCPTAKMEDGRDIDKALQHDNTFDLYSKITNDPDYFTKLEKRRKAKKAKRERLEREAVEAQKSAAVGQVENIVAEMLQPYANIISNLEDIVKKQGEEIDVLRSGVAAATKK